tara:strand:+ start:138 stop:659 length:522 start_codon:yes stop_codon:yes gene_type:complete
MDIIVDPNTTLAKAILKHNKNYKSGTVDDVKNNDVFIQTQGTLRGTPTRLINKNFTEIVDQADQIQHIAQRMIVIGSVSADFPSWPGMNKPGMNNERFTYNTAKQALKNWVHGWNQSIFVKHKGVTGMKIQILSPAVFKSKIGDDTGLIIEEVVKNINYLIDNPHVTEISLRQ